MDHRQFGTWALFDVDICMSIVLLPYMPHIGPGGLGNLDLISSITRLDILSRTALTWALFDVDICMSIVLLPYMPHIGPGGLGNLDLISSITRLDILSRTALTCSPSSTFLAG